MTDLKISISIDKQLQKSKRLSFYSIIVFDRSFLIVLIGDFYQFVLILGKTFLNYLIS